MILLLDNYDSFTYNLLHYMCELGAEVEVRRNNKITVEEALNLPGLDGVVVSPGPCTPTEAGISLELIRAAAEKRIPLFGVCLGHQAIGQAFGGEVVRAPAPVHGKVAEIFHEGKGVFAGIPSPFQATRYHSLVISRDTLPDCLTVTAETADGLIMGVQHKDYPLHGVQFHPESIASQHGHVLLGNFLAVCA